MSILYLEVLIMGGFLVAWFDVLNVMVEMIVQFSLLLAVSYITKAVVIAVNWWFLVRFVISSSTSFLWVQFIQSFYENLVFTIKRLLHSHFSKIYCFRQFFFFVHPIVLQFQRKNGMFYWFKKRWVDFPFNDWQVWMFPMDNQVIY